jgi:hypothetical protein
MPEYMVGGQKIRRKNLYMPCILGPRVEKMTEEEIAQTYKATWWADLITNTEWPALLKEEGFNASARSRLKKKAAGWVIALGRIAYLNPDLFAEVLKRAGKEYREQTESEHPFLESIEMCSRTEAEWEAEYGADADRKRRRGWVVTYGYLDERETE